MNKKGFTLVELLIALAICGIMMMLVVSIVSTARITYFTADARIGSQQDLRKALRVMIRELSESKIENVDIPTPNEIVFQIPIKVVDGGSLDGEMYDNDRKPIFGARLKPSLEPDGVQDYAVMYTLEPNYDVDDSNKLVRRVLDSFPSGNQVGTDIIIANSIQNIEFANVSFPPTYDSTGKMVTICHIPPGNPDNAHTITVAQSAVSAHLKHGDYLGPCTGQAVSSASNSAVLTIKAAAVGHNKFGRIVNIETVFNVILRN